MIAETRARVKGFASGFAVLDAHSSFLSLTDDPAQCFFCHHQIDRVTLNPTGNHRAMDQCKNCLRLRNTFLFRKAKSHQMIRIEFLPVIVESAAVNYRTKKMGYNAAKELYKRVQANLARKKED